ncbi:MAG: hypothetical protein HYT12_03520 [Candidatus Liptonbacteria bacterium]|nr:hypothetical protein [Candidatus Liptonbacteria bacterium]
MDFKNLGFLDFREFLEIQNGLVDKRKLDEIADTIIFAEHPTTISLGARSSGLQLAHLRYYSPYWLTQNGIPIVKTSRGGSLAVHGPGILGCYFIFKLKDLSCASRFFRSAQSLAKRTLTRARIYADKLPDELRTDQKEKTKYRGLWVMGDSSPRKIASMGVGVSRKVTSFGMNINVSPEDWILRLVYPCGIREYELTSAAREGGNACVDFYIQNLIELAPQYLP